MFKERQEYNGLALYMETICSAMNCYFARKCEADVCEVAVYILCVYYKLVVRGLNISGINKIYH